MFLDAVDRLPFYNPQKLLFIVNIFVGNRCSTKTRKVIAVVVIVVAFAVTVVVAVAVVDVAIVAVVNFKVTVKVLPEI